MEIQPPKKLRILFYNFFILGFLALGLAGCATRIPNPAQGAPNMAQTYLAAMQNNPSAYATNGKDKISKNGISKNLQLPQLEKTPDNFSQTRGISKIENKIIKKFPKLKNPEVVVYVYPHFEYGMPFAGNWTVFSLYKKNHYQFI